jgi:hypothetical protein
MWSGGEYNDLCDIPPITTSFVSGVLPFSFPSLPRWDRSTLNPFGIALLARLVSWFDGPALIRMAFRGVCFLALGLVAGSRPAWPNRFSDDAAGNSAADYFSSTLLPKMLRKGHCRIALPAEIPRCIVHTISLIPKAAVGTFRMIHDLTCTLESPSGQQGLSFNESTPHWFLPKTRLATIEGILEVLSMLAKMGFRATVHLASVDLESAYYQIHLAPGEDIKLGFLHDGTVYLFLGLPFGAKGSPSIFCRFVNLVWCFLRHRKVMIFWYIDDGLIIGVTLEETRRAVALTLETLAVAGFQVSRDKSQLDGYRSLDYIGVCFDLDAWVVRLLPRHVAKIEGYVTLLLATPAWRGADLHRTLDRFTGLLNFAEVVVSQLRGIKNFLIGVKSDAERHPSRPRSISREARFHLETCRVLSVTRNERPIRSRADCFAPWFGHQLYSDACHTGSALDSGYGAWFRTPAGHVYYLYGLWAEAPGNLLGLHINDLELLAAVMALSLLLPVAGSPFPGVFLHTDNTSALRWINALSCKLASDPRGSRLRRLRFMRALAIWLEEQGLLVDALHVPGVFNEWADWLSRQRLTDFLHAVRDAPVIQEIEVPRSWWLHWTTVLLSC